VAGTDNEEDDEVAATRYDAAIWMMTYLGYLGM
jgi:hypothetical protein